MAYTLQADEETGRGKDESDSVVNQRGLIHQFLDNHGELSKIPCTEFVDDGFSGNTPEGLKSNLHLKWGLVIFATNIYHFLLFSIKDTIFSIDFYV